MKQYFVIDRASGKLVEEKTPLMGALRFLYGKGPFATLGRFFVCRFSFVSSFFGWLKKRPKSAEEIEPFIQAYGIDREEFAKPVEEFSSFNDFFIRKLKKGVRPLVSGDEVAILPADGRYLAFEEFGGEGTVTIKDASFSLEKLLGGKFSKEPYEGGALVISRLAPVDYHRFHFPCSNTPDEPVLINGPLYSVHPIALKHNFGILSENKRVITPLKTRKFGMVLCIEVGATNVGSIKQTFLSGQFYSKGEEKGYFSFGGSSLLLLFERGAIELDSDLIENTQKGKETYSLMGQSLGRSAR